MRLILLLLVLALAGCDRQKPETPQGEQAAAEAAGGSEKGVDRGHQGQAAPDTVFLDPEGGDIRLADFKGTPVLVNLWATWCAPCVKELPTLDKLAEAQAVDGQLGVIAISQDMAPQSTVKEFLAKLGVEHAGAYHDDKMALSAALGVEVMPTTILFGSDGKEIWRFVGDLDWTGAEATKLLSEAK